MIPFRFTYPNELWHHGIPNQRWGVRNGPPYPLDKKTSARVKAGKIKKVRVSAKEYRDMRSGKIKTDKTDKAGTTHYAAYRESRLREVMNTSDLGVVNVATAIKNGDFTPDNHPSDTKSSNIHGRLSYNDVRAVNWQIRESDESGLRNNCVKCTSTLEMRRRGYDVCAGRASGGMLSSATQYYWDGAVPYKENYNNIQSRIDSFGRGGTGEFIARRADGSGHSVYFMKEKHSWGYQQQFIDGQDGRVYESLDDLYRAQCFDKTQMAQITRLDNATPNYDHMAEDSVLRMTYANENMNRIVDVKNDRMFNAGTRWTG